MVKRLFYKGTLGKIHTISNIYIDAREKNI